MACPRLLLSRTLGVLTVAAFLCAPIAAARAQDSNQDSNPVVARANGVDIRASDLAFAEEEIGANMPQMSPDQKRDYLITYLADVVVLSQAAEQQQLDQHPDVKRRLDFDHNRVLMEALLQATGQASVN